ncbi:alpha-ketoglutarate-dependent dioxygenase AlkB, partial [Klebsiella pneumoniae]|nr:alpha-ketoglutarate-dependent dioxygenase AlkB [Klebsiella pneumoniae]
MLDLFSDTPPWQEPLAPGAVVLRRFARERAPALLQAIADVASQSPFRQMVTPGGYTMSVAMTNCGALGWTTDRHGYLYAPVDPVTDQTWPPMPAVFHELALAAAAPRRPPPPGAAGFAPPPGFFNPVLGGQKRGWGGVKKRPG